MIGLEDRRTLAQDIATAHSTGARLGQACEVAGIDERTLQCWKAQEGLVAGDGRPQAVRPSPPPSSTVVQAAVLQHCKRKTAVRADGQAFQAAIHLATTRPSGSKARPSVPGVAGAMPLNAVPPVSRKITVCWI